MIDKLPYRHRLINNHHKEIIESIIHFLMVSEDECEKYNTFGTPSLNHMVNTLNKYGYEDGMVGYVSEHSTVRPWIDSPMEFFRDTERAVNHLNSMIGQN